MNKRFCAVVAASISSAACAQVLYTETFENGVEGWSVWTTNGNTFAAAYLATGGSPGGGFIRSSDPDNGVSYWRAPETFRSALAGAMGGSVSYEGRVSPLTPLIFHADVIATGGGQTLYLDLPDPVSNAWLPFRAYFDLCAHWRVGSLTGPLATYEQIQAMLADCTDFLIRAEYRNGAETNDLDTVVIETTGRVFEAALSAFDTDLEGWGATGDYFPLEWIADGGNPDGYLRVRDRNTGTLITYVAPQKFLCDQGTALGGIVSFDLKTTANESTPSASQPDVWLEGANGLVMAARLPFPPLPTWTSYEIPLVAAAWRVGNMVGPVATAEEFYSVLSNMSGLRIRAEYSSTADIGGLDNVYLGNPFPCPADFNQDGGVDGSDVDDFFAAWSEGLPSADVNYDGGVDGLDVETFFNAWEAGGCE
jgi:hypothetical protein